MVAGHELTHGFDSNGEENGFEKEKYLLRTSNPLVHLIQLFIHLNPVIYPLNDFVDTI